MLPAAPSKGVAAASSAVNEFFVVDVVNVVTLAEGASTDLAMGEEARATEEVGVNFVASRPEEGETETEANEAEV